MKRLLVFPWDEDGSKRDGIRAEQNSRTHGTYVLSSVILFFVSPRTYKVHQKGPETVNWSHRLMIPNPVRKWYTNSLLKLTNHNTAWISGNKPASDWRNVTWAVFFFFFTELVSRKQQSVSWHFVYNFSNIPAKRGSPQEGRPYIKNMVRRYGFGCWTSSLSVTRFLKFCFSCIVVQAF